jgi:hypothetical protein
MDGCARTHRKAPNLIHRTNVGQTKRVSHLSANPLFYLAPPTALVFAALVAPAGRTSCVSRGQFMPLKHDAGKLSWRAKATGN